MTYSTLVVLTRGNPRAMQRGALLLVFGALLCVAAHARTCSCATLEGHKWRVVKMGEKTYEGKEDITAVFAEQKVDGYTGINRYHTSYKCGNENSISISGSFTMTEKAGTNEQLDAEKQFLEALQSAVRYHVDDDVLVLFDAARVVRIVFSNIDV